MPINQRQSHPGDLTVTYDTNPLRPLKVHEPFLLFVYMNTLNDHLEPMTLHENTNGYQNYVY